MCANLELSSGEMRLIGQVSSEKTSLWTKYRRAFDAWALQVNRLRAVTDSPVDDSFKKEIKESAAAAEIVYRDSRDRLMDALVNEPDEASVLSSVK